PIRRAARKLPAFHIDQKPRAAGAEHDEIEVLDRRVAPASAFGFIDGDVAEILRLQIRLERGFVGVAAVHGNPPTSEPERQRGQQKTLAAARAQISSRTLLATSSDDTVRSSRLARSLIFHSPFANSSGPAISARRKPRFSAYWNWAPIFFASGKTSTPMPAARSVRALCCYSPR